MAYYRDVREYLHALEAAGKLVRVKQPINKDTEMHPLVRLQVPRASRSRSPGFFV
jgi:4-hydroxy-3-polyprenylbenzoate decarboxylase